VPFAQDLLLSIYYLLLGVVLAVMVYRGLLIVRYYRRPRVDPVPAARYETEPVVTVQLPIFNEQFVVERLLEGVCALDWPRDRLEVQLLDDSTDDTVEIAARKVAELRARGFDVKHLHRTDRSGYKAGALKAATPHARGDLLAVFDADFVPEPDFLRRMVDHFTDPKVAFVQSRWGYFNREHNLITQGMGLLMDGHFVLEQATRSRGGYVFNFNGTGGIWRRQAIEAAGGWDDATICEDTDLSYRTYLAGYRGVYLKDVVCPSEIPVVVSALKTQQHRWAKGLTECLLKLMPRLWRSSLPLRAKVEGTFHLGANMAFPASLFLTVLAIPILMLRLQGVEAGSLARAVDFVAFSLVIVTQVLFYVVATREVHPDWRRRLVWLPFPMLVGVGLAVNNARGVMEALTGHKSEFVRTPKLGVAVGDMDAQRRRASVYKSRRALAQGLLEVALGVVYVIMAVVQSRTMLVGSIVTGFLSLGLFFMGFSSLRGLWGAHVGAASRPAEEAPAVATLAGTERVGA
jgi:cellulose synthase/poly-beta-1,6-N-acetylglucosamine synthase-like glycosyltransferase